mgnify:FL=1
MLIAVDDVTMLDPTISAKRNCKRKGKHWGREETKTNSISPDQSVS